MMPAEMQKSHKKAIAIAVAVALTLLFIAAAAAIYYMPNITVQLNGEKNLVWECGTVYEDAGARAYLDSFLADKTPELTEEGMVDWETPGDYTITYKAKYGPLSASGQRKVTVADTLPPVLTLLGDQEISFCLETGSYTEPGWTAEDLVDGDLTDKVTVEGQIGAELGTYTLTYTVQDAAGNTAQASRTVTVTPLRQADDVVNTHEKIVYLTFDDGPGPYTRGLLDVLAKYNVKATFFVTNNKYRYLIGEAAAEGHTVAIHSATHNYRKIYSSSEAFFADLEAMQNVIIEQTGKPATLLRFPGGSSNTVSKFNRGIMTRLAAEVEEKGFQYADWNVLSGDAGDTTQTSKVVENVINGMKRRNEAVVLQHDIKKFSVDAVEEIIRWGLLNGYTFLPMDETSPMAHHGINN